MQRLVNEISRPLYERLLAIVGAIIGLPARDKKTGLCANSGAGQLMLGVSLPGPVAQLWPELKIDGKGGG